MGINYFDFFEISEDFFPNETLLKKKYYSLVKKYHPDRYNSQDDVTQQKLENLSSTANEAYQTLSDFELRVEYILRSNNVLKENEKDIPQEFLMEVMDINESLFEIEMEGNSEKLETIREKIGQLGESLRFEVEESMKAYKNVGKSRKEEILKLVKDYYLKNKYLLRILDKIANFAEH